MKVIRSVKYRGKYRPALLEVSDRLVSKRVEFVPCEIEELPLKESIVNQEALNRFMLDMEKVEPLFVRGGRDPLESFILAGELDTRAVFYHGRDLFECFEIQDKALVCVDYLTFGSDELLKEAAFQFIKHYRMLRLGKRNPKFKLTVSQWKEIQTNVYYF